MRKRILMLAACLCMVAVLLPAISTTAQAHSDNGGYPYSVASGVYRADAWGFYQCECTSFAAYCVNARNGFALKNDMYGRDDTNRWGDAKHWGSVAQLHGIAVDSNPRVGDVAWNSSGPFGHVAWVCAVNGDKVTIDEYNYGYNGRYWDGEKWHGNHLYNTRPVDKSAFLYIHFPTNSTPTPPQPAPPSCSLATPRETSELGEKYVTFTAVPSDAAVSVYPVNGRTESRTGSVTVVAEKTTTYTVTVSKSGYTSHKSSYTVSVPQAAAPVISTSESPGKVTVTMSCATPNTMIFYEINGMTSRYSGPFPLEKDCTITAYAVGYGCSQSASVTRSIEMPVLKPVSVSVSKEKVAVGDPVMVSWTKSSQAEAYTAKLLDSSGTVLKSYTTSGCSTVFSLESAGDYSIVVTAQNNIDAKDSQAVSVSAMPDVTASFYIADENGDRSLYQSYTVRYGYSAEYPSRPPVRRGYSFNGWVGGSLSSMTSDQEFTASFSINYYTVSFYDYTGKLMSSNSYPYGSSAVEPSPPPCKVGYVFAGWAVTYAKEEDSACDWTTVDSDMRLQAVQCWGEPSIPVEASISEAVYDSAQNMYAVTVQLYSDPDADGTGALLRVALKSNQDQMVKTQSREIVLSADAEQKITFSIPCNDIVHTVEAYVLGRDAETGKTGSALSRVAEADVFNPSEYTWSDWSDWTSDPAAGSDWLQAESKTQYAYSDKQYTTSPYSSLAGWTRYDSTSSYGAYGSWSGWQTTSISSSSLRQVETRTVTDGYYSLCYLTRSNSGYREYRSYSVGGNYWGYGLSSSYGEFNYSGAYHDTSWWNSRKTVGEGGYASWASNTAGYNRGSGVGYEDENCCVVFKGTPVTHTEYRYRTRSLNYTYYYYKWNEYSDWQDEAVAANSDRLVTSRTLYRTRQLVPISSSPPETGFAETESRTVTGTIPVTADLSGMLATVMVYNSKNNDPNESQIQYIGQVTLGPDNSYTFSYRPKEEPTAEKGDYVIALGIQGSTGLINIAVEDAPKASYTVQFIGQSGDILSTQVVEEGEDAVFPLLSPVEGYRFVTWSGSPVNVRANQTISAIYVPMEYAVAYVDWVNDTIPSLETAKYGDKLTAPDTPSAEGRDFLYWGIDGEEIDWQNYTVSGNTLVTAVYSEPKSYTVEFLNADGSVLESQTVVYGQSAAPPAYSSPVPEGKSFLGWDTDSCWWNVSESLRVRPLIAYAETAAMPQSSLGRVSYSSAAALSLSAAEEAVIYYTTDGTVPTKSSDVYNGTIQLSGQDATVRAISVEDGKNTSEILEVNFISTGNAHPANWQELSSDTIDSGGVFELAVGLPDNPGFWGYHFKIACDPSDVFLECVWNGSTLSPEALGNEGTMVVENMADGYEIYWSGPIPSADTDEVFSAIVSVSAGAAPAPISVYYDTDAAVVVGDGEGIPAQSFHAGLSAIAVNPGERDDLRATIAESTGSSANVRIEGADSSLGQDVIIYAAKYDGGRLLAVIRGTYNPEKYEAAFSGAVQPGWSMFILEAGTLRPLCAKLTIEG